jgi:hypothetical protein
MTAEQGAPQPISPSKEPTVPNSRSPRYPPTRRGPVIALALAGLAFTGGMIAIAALRVSKEEPAAAPTSAVILSVSAEDMSVCGLEGFEEESSLTEAPENGWDMVGTAAAPALGSKAGPAVEREDGLRYCYAHTAEGALSAIINYVGLDTDARTIPLIGELVAPGLGREAAELNAQTRDPSSTRLQVAGFKVNSYSTDEAVIDLALSATSQDGQLISFPIAVTWAEGDWKIQMTDTGELTFRPALLQNLGGYIPWSAP